MLKAIQMVILVGSSSSSTSLLSTTTTTSCSSSGGFSSIVSQNRHKWNIIKLKPNTIKKNIIVVASYSKPYSSYPCFSTITSSSFSKTNRLLESPVSRMSSSSSSAAPRPAGHVLKIKFCEWCGGPTKHEIPDGEEKMRAICTLCGKIAYQNPKMVVGCLIEHEGKVLLCKRNIEPSYGLWTLPAGYMEIGESGAEGAIRETWEEARAEVELLSPFAQLDIPLIGQTYIIFLAKLKKPYFAPGPESLECQLFTLDDIPYDSLAFSSIYVTLSLYKEDVKNGRLKFHYGTINKRPGSGPSDARAYTLDCHMES